jgi:thimet oligopeptidase
MAEDRRPIGLADYARLTADDVRDAVDEGLAGADQALAGASPGTGLAVLDAISDAARCVWTAYGRSAFLAAVHPDGAVRDAADDASQRISRWRSRLLRDPGVFAALEGIDPASLDVEARAVRSRWIGAMRRAGAELGDAERVELDALGARVPPQPAR